MAGRQAPIDMDRWVKTQEALTRAMRGEKVSVEEACLPPPPFDCKNCSDTRFVVEKRFDGTVHGHRCPECRTRVDAAVRREAKGADPDIPDTPAPVERSWRQVAGNDDEED